MLSRITPHPYITVPGLHYASYLRITATSRPHTSTIRLAQCLRTRRLFSISVSSLSISQQGPNNRIPRCVVRVQPKPRVVRPAGTSAPTNRQVRSCVLVPRLTSYTLLWPASSLPVIAIRWPPIDFEPLTRRTGTGWPLCDQDAPLPIGTEYLGILFSPHNSVRTTRGQSL